MGQFVHAIEGIGAACTALDMPIVSGNVSLYNETDGTAILPTPTIGAVGLIDDPGSAITGTARDGHVALVLGDTRAIWGNRRCWPRCSTAPRATRRPSISTPNGATAISSAPITPISAPAPMSDGGLALAAFEMAEAAGVGIASTERATPPRFSARIRPAT